ncbi:MAG: nucleotidyltransferase domain-containing protein [Methanocellales archaeon]|nr:nucleotidyltransferase domain-containing protein [Methanocellales archaeon]MDI6902814.1 nucleotidyltransferase domain-containing protein [Methanocellales archaeon]
MEIDKVIDELKKDEVEAIYLFGSRVKGSVKPFSDIDICVLTDRDIPKKVKEEILSNSSKKIDISIFWDLPPMIQFRVLKEGKILYKKDDLTLQRVKAEILKSYLDVQPMIKRYCSRILGE